MKTAQVTKRSNVTVDDRRRVLSMARGRKPADIAKVDQATFLRQQLKAMMGWTPKEKAPESIILASKNLAHTLQREAQEALAAKTIALAKKAASQP